MPAVDIRETHEFTAQQLEELFLSVEWSSGHYPERLVKAMRNFETVFAAWDGDTLAGLICAMDDGSMTAYVHYLLVRPEYQGMGIGKRLVERVKERYADYLRIVVIAYDDEAGFYESCGFEKSNVSSPLFITSLWT